MKIINIIEARSNPTLNTKISTIDQLKQYKDDPTIYVSFTNVDKIGVNPNSKFHTPIGIYTYPLQLAWQNYNVQYTFHFPWANDAPFIQVLQTNTQPFILQNVTEEFYQQTMEKIKPYRKKLYYNKMMSLLNENPNISMEEINRVKEILYPNTNEGTVEEFFKRKNDVRFIEDLFFKKFEDGGDMFHLYVKPLLDNQTLDTVIYGMHNTYSDDPPTKFWNLTRLATNFYADTVKYKQSPVQWNAFLRKFLGLKLIQDNNGGIIYKAEPTQAVFLGPYFKHVNKIINDKDDL